MKERPIRFNGQMVRATLDGRKTQARWAAKPGWWQCLDPEDAEDLAQAVTMCPHGAPDDRLWVKETYAVDVPGCLRGVSYRADHQDPRGDGPAHPMCWRPSIHMPRWASRLTLDVTRVHVERLQDISEEDAIAEGLIPVVGPNSQQMWAYSETTGGHFGDPRVAFHMLWNNIHGAKAWARNPWVWVVEFKKVGET